MSEQASETKALHKAIFKPLRKFFRNLDDQTTSKYGNEFPMFHNELKDWVHFKDVYNLYQADVSATAAKAAAATAAAKAAATDSAPVQPPAAKKRRKSRFSSADDDASTSSSSSSRFGASTGTTKARARKSRFSTSTINAKEQQLALLNARLSDLQKEFLQLPAKAAKQEKEWEVDPVKPIYDSNGKRTNSLIDRMQKNLMEKRIDVLRKMVKCDPSIKDKLRRQGVNTNDLKYIRKLYIPTKDFPGYNFFGLIIGPRGKTQKAMEAKAGVSIAIRGKGSVKEGMRGRRDGKSLEGENEPLHVRICGETEEAVNYAIELVTPLLNPIDDDKNAHKQAQLRELALINGTLREDVYCQICGEQGHRQFECPKRNSQNEQFRAQVRCAICGKWWWWWWSFVVVLCCGPLLWSFFCSPHLLFNNGLLRFNPLAFRRYKGEHQTL